MKVLFKHTKENKCYHEFVEDPSDRKKLRAFGKYFGSTLADEAVKLHRRIKQFPTAADYNKIYGSTLNRIEIKQGEKDKEPFIFKVRVTGGYRKFFHQVVCVEEVSFLKTADWKGKFEDITDIYVIEVNNHDYKGV